MEKAKIEIVDGVGGYSLYINDTRVVGPKPLGGGRLVKAFAVTEQDIIDALPALREALEKAEKWNTYQAELVKEKAHTDRFISLMDAEEDELRRDAGLWRKVKEIASSRHLIACADCPVTKQCRNGAEGLCSSVYKLVAALSEVPHGK